MDKYFPKEHIHRLYTERMMRMGVEGRYIKNRDELWRLAIEQVNDNVKKQYEILRACKI